MKLYEITVVPAVLHDRVATFMSIGDAVDVEGVRMVRLPSGSIVPADGWHETLQAAQAAVADRIETIGQRILWQAAVLREASNG